MYLYVPPFKSPPKAHTYNNGNFFFENIRPGKYYLQGFMSGSLDFTFTFRSKEELDRAAFLVRPGELHYVGSYEVTGMKNGFFSPGSFDIERVQRPDKEKIFREIMEAAAGTGWDKRIEKYLKMKYPK